MDSLTRENWEERYLGQDTPWDIGYASPALIQYCVENVEKDAKILIPGCGNGYEFDVLTSLGYTGVSVCDWSDSALDAVRRRNPLTDPIRFLKSDFFELEGEYDCVLEQTFFCAIDPEFREAYVDKVSNLLRREGILAGLLFANTFDKEGPPFGGTIAEYEELFCKTFKISVLEVSQLSIAPRAGNELFIVAQKP